MSQFICPHCQGEFHTCEDHHCYKLQIIERAPGRAQEQRELATESRTLARKFPRLSAP